jgi:hypothetical protein
MLAFSEVKALKSHVMGHFLKVGHGNKNDEAKENLNSSEFDR